MTHAGGKTLMRSKCGFTLLELLVVVLMIGVLATIALASYPYMREKAGDAAAKSDLKNAAILQEEYYGDNQTYADQAALDGVFVGSENVTLTVVSADMGGYEMSATHTASTSTFCLSSADGAVVSC
jgi:prepilin-type N-terminal cleavage/methylation domain-containing protein